jgi:hypothetical protein
VVVEEEQEEGEGPSNDRSTLSTDTTKSVKDTSKRERLSSRTQNPASAALGLDVGRRRAHKGTQGDAIIPCL